MKNKQPKIKAVPRFDKSTPFWKCLFIWLTTNKKWEVAEDVRYKLESGETILVKKGFVFDGASIPRILRPIISPVGILLVPSVFHDFAYQNKFVLKTSSNRTYFYKQTSDRKYWDSLFKDMSKETHSLKIISILAWAAVRVGGFFSWNSIHASGVKQGLSKAFIKYGAALQVITIISMLYGVIA